MSLKEKIAVDLKTAQKAGDVFRLEVMRFLVAQIQNKEIEKRSAEGDASLNDVDVLAIFQREAKKRKEAIDLFIKGGRADLAEKEKAELLIIQEYLPIPMSEGEVEDVVRKVLSEGANEFAPAMKETMKRLGGKADGKIVSDIIKRLLA